MKRWRIGRHSCDKVLFREEARCDGAHDHDHGLGIVSTNLRLFILPNCWNVCHFIFLSFRLCCSEVIKERLPTNVIYQVLEVCLLVYVNVVLSWASSTKPWFIISMSLIFFCIFCLNLFGIRQFAPLDMPFSMDVFLQYWRPNAVMLMESELWPNLIMGAARNGVSIYSRVMNRNYEFMLACLQNRVI